MCIIYCQRGKGFVTCFVLTLQTKVKKERGSLGKVVNNPSTRVLGSGGQDQLNSLHPVCKITNNGLLSVISRADSLSLLIGLS